MILNTGPEFVEIDGMLVEADALRIAEKVKAYDENLEILCVDPALAEFSDAPYILVEKCTDGQYRKISDFWELDERVMETVEASDQNRHDLVAVINGRNVAIRKEKERRYRDMMEEKKDIVAHIAGMKSQYSVRDGDDIVTFYDDRPAERKPA